VTKLAEGSKGEIAKIMPYSKQLEKVFWEISLAMKKLGKRFSQTDATEEKSNRQMAGCSEKGTN
jgi:hypothetical protein